MQCLNLRLGSGGALQPTSDASIFLRGTIMPQNSGNFYKRGVLYHDYSDPTSCIHTELYKRIKSSDLKISHIPSQTARKEIGRVQLSDEPRTSVENS